MSIEAARAFAEEAHRGQMRKGTTTPYIEHPLEVARILEEAGCSGAVIVAGLLHDTVEDAQVPLPRIGSQFGDEVRRIVNGVSENKQLSWAERKRHTVRELPTVEHGVALVSAADKLANARDLLADHQRDGEATWERFNAPYRRQRRYYRALTAALESRAEEEPLAGVTGELRATVDELFPPEPVFDLERLLLEVEARSTSNGSSLHGDEHWRRVARNGSDLLAEEPLADPQIVFLFALLHDAGRLNDGHDPEHGRRAATLARELHQENLLPIRDGDQLGLLRDALERHADGETHRKTSDAHDPTIGVCWDADRLDLWRVGNTPNPDLLSSTVDDWRPLIDRRGEGKAGDWPTLYERYRAVL